MSNREIIQPTGRQGVRFPLRRGVIFLLLGVTLFAAGAPDCAWAKKKKKGADDEPVGDPYAAYVWPPPPDEARIKLEEVIRGRANVEAKGSKLKKFLIGLEETSPYDSLKKPFAVAIDPQNRVLVTDFESRAILRFDLAGEVLDVLGTKGSFPLKNPMGISVAEDETIYVADGGLKSVLAMDSDGNIVAVYGGEGQLSNPTDAVLSPDGERLYVADSAAHQIVVFEKESGDIEATIGSEGADLGHFSFPTSLAFGPEGQLFVVDQLNARIQVFGTDGEFEFAFGQRGTSFGSFVRPKDIAVDEVGLIYVTDNAFNNFQLFDFDGTLLTFVGEGGPGPGQFLGASGIAVRGDLIAVVDQIGKRLQVFRFVGSKGE